MIAGISPEMIARYTALGGAGGGATQGVMGAGSMAQSTVGLGYAMSLRGSKIDEMLARIASATTQMAEQGMSLDLEATTKSMALFHEAGATREGKNPLEGMFGVRAALRLSQAGVQTRGQMAGQFRGLSDAAIMAEAYSTSTSPLEAMMKVEEMSQNPEVIREVLVKHLGEEGAALAMSSMMGARAAETLATLPTGQNLLSGIDTGAMAGNLPTVGGQIYSSQFARQDARLMGIAEGMAGNAEIIAVSTNINALMMQLSSDADEIITAFNAMITLMESAAASP
jgi:hypothetical protein